jgi:cytochrome c553
LKNARALPALIASADANKNIAFTYDRHSSTMTRTRPIAALALLALPMLAWAQAAPSGDPVAGQRKTQMCAGCHSIPGWRTAYPEVYSVPKIGGQHPAYIVKALQAYKSGERNHPSMRAIAATLSDQDMADLAAYYGGTEPKTATK